MKIYLDNCCLNRPFDSQIQTRVKLETEAILKIQEQIKLKIYILVWSYILDFENSKNPFKERKLQIEQWKALSTTQINANQSIISTAELLQNLGLHKFDALHIACAIKSNCEYFLTTDDKILNKCNKIELIKIIDPFGFVKEMKL